MDYIILHKEKNGEYKPLTFSNGSIIIYGNREEAKEDLRDCDVIFAICEDDSLKTEENVLHEFNLGDIAFYLDERQRLKSSKIVGIRAYSKDNVSYELGGIRDYKAEYLIGKTPDDLWRKIQLRSKDIIQNH